MSNTETTSNREDPDPGPSKLPLTETVKEKKYGRFKYRKTPHCIYFFYIGEKDPTTKWNKIIHYYDRGDDKAINTKEELYQRISDLIVNARKEEQFQFPPPNGAGWSRIVLDRISYVVFAFDFKLTSGPEFEAYSGNNPNHSFFDGEVTTLQGCKVAYCINHLKASPGGDPLGREGQPFRFEFKTVPEIDWYGKKGRLPDSGGTNTGPGASPPD